MLLGGSVREWGRRGGFCGKTLRPPGVDAGVRAPAHVPPACPGRRAPASAGRVAAWRGPGPRRRRAACAGPRLRGPGCAPLAPAAVPPTAPAMLVMVMVMTVLFCSVLFCSVLFCSVLFCSVLFCSVLFCSVLFCSVLFCSVPFNGERKGEEGATFPDESLTEKT